MTFIRKSYGTKYLPHPALRLLLIFFISMAMAGCGYHVSGGKAGGGGSGGKLPGGAKTLSIPYFVNNTARAGVEAVITDALVMEFKNIAEITDSEPEARIDGAVTRYELVPVAFTSTDIVQAYRLYITLSVTLVSTNDSSILWKERSITDFEDFSVSINNISATKEAERQAFKNMSFDTARIIKERMLEGF